MSTVTGSAHIPVLETDVCIVGSGPAGCTYAKVILDRTDKRVFMAEMGTQQSSVLGENLKNNIDAFSHVIMGHLHNLEPGNKDLPGASATYAVGGMSTHWTCAVPRPHPDEMPTDLPWSDDKAEWNRLYSYCERLIGADPEPFQHLIGQQIVKHALNEGIQGRDIIGLPLAVQTIRIIPTFIGRAVTRLWSDTHVRKIEHRNGVATLAICEDLVTGQIFHVRARQFVVACGAILSPQLLHVSKIGNDNNGRYLTDHPVAFTQVVLADKHLAWARKNPSFADRLKGMSDPIPIPFDEPVVWKAGPSAGKSRYFSGRRAGYVGNAKTKLPLSAIGGRQIALREYLYRHGQEALGPYLPGSEPHWRPYGQALHACGTTRIGPDPQTSVLDPYSRVHDFSNLFVGGNNVIPTSNSVNPTLTTMVFAVKGAEMMISQAGWDTATARL
ncbi:hypothetical protein P7C73_g963, partial [Tremellales sp. Uapishka_1]